MPFRATLARTLLLSSRCEAAQAEIDRRYCIIGLKGKMYLIE